MPKKTKLIDLSSRNRAHCLQRSSALASLASTWTSSFCLFFSRFWRPTSINFRWPFRLELSAFRPAPHAFHPKTSPTFCLEASRSTPSVYQVYESDPSTCCQVTLGLLSIFKSHHLLYEPTVSLTPTTLLALRHGTKPLSFHSAASSSSSWTSCQATPSLTLPRLG